jgi:hypothetical protein
MVSVDGTVDDADSFVAGTAAPNLLKLTESIAFGLNEC